jgi:hypothetical protein
MWECQKCGEEGNENPFNFCLSCGAPKPDFPEVVAVEEEVKTAFSSFINDTPKQPVESHIEEEATPQEGRWHIPRSLSVLSRKMKGVFPINNGDLNHVKVSLAAQDKLDALVLAGVFDTKAEAAAYLIEQGIKAEFQLFEVVEQKLSEIERLRSELRHLVKDNRE